MNPVQVAALAKMLLEATQLKGTEGHWFVEEREEECYEVMNYMEENVAFFTRKEDAEMVCRMNMLLPYLVEHFKNMVGPNE